MPQNSSSGNRISNSVPAITESVASWTLSWIHGAPIYPNRTEFLRSAIQASKVGGLFCEFGVYNGNSLAFIAEALGPQFTVHGFDAWKGLPKSSPGTERENWPEGAFLADMPSRLPKNTVLHDGWFSDTLPKFVADHRGEWASFLHCDADIYDSTVTILEEFEPLIVPGTVIVFDEMLWWPGWAERGEARAWAEFVDRTGMEFSCIGLVEDNEKVAVRID